MTTRAQVKQWNETTHCQCGHDRSQHEASLQGTFNIAFRDCLAGGCTCDRFLSINYKLRLRWIEVFAPGTQAYAVAEAYWKGADVGLPLYDIIIENGFRLTQYGVIFAPGALPARQWIDDFSVCLSQPETWFWDERLINLFKLIFTPWVWAPEPTLNGDTRL